MTRLAWLSRGLFLAAAVVGAGHLVQGCSSNNPNLDPGGGTGMPHGGAVCSAGVQGCSCSQAGQSVACGRISSQTGSYVTCSEGYSKCESGKWGECIGNKIVVKSLPGQGLGAGGIMPLNMATSCSNLCDPNCGGDFEEDAGSVAPPGFVDDGGLSLLQGEAGAACTGLGCDVAPCGGSPASTTITGTVYDPAGNNPLYNVTVYVPTTVNGSLPAFTTGVSEDQCSGATVTAVTSTTTAADGTFTLTGVPSTVANIPIVVQSGKWRRELILTHVTSCAANTVTTSSCKAGTPAGECVLRLPGSGTDGYDWNTAAWGYADMPQLAISTGSADPLECLLLEVGISTTEFGSPGGNPSGHVDMYYDPYSPGTFLDPHYNGSSSVYYAGDSLWNSPTNLALYDAVLLPCNGNGNDKYEAGKSPYANIINYTDVGGRAFLTHFSYVWLEYPSETWFGHSSPYVAGPDNWSTVATWLPDTYGPFGGTIDTQDPLPATVDTSFPKGSAFSTWLGVVNATVTAGELYLHQARQDLYALGPNSQDWMVANDSSGSVPSAEQAYNPHFTFNTPYLNPPATQYGRVVYSDFHASATALNTCASHGGNEWACKCLSNEDCGYGQTCNGAVIGTIGTCTEPCKSSADCADSTYSCVGGSTGTCGMAACNHNHECASLSCNKPAGVCNCTSGSQCESGTCTAGACTASTCTGPSTRGSVEACNISGGGTGHCSKSCSSSAQCTGGETCTGGLCQGCYSNTNCTSYLDGAHATCTGGSSTTGTCASVAPLGTWNASGFGGDSDTTFPQACQQIPMTPQEKALEFMFFDLTGCVSSDTGPPPPPPFAPATFTQTFNSTCGPGFKVVWRELDWQANVPATSSIAFSAQSGPTLAGLLPATPVSLATATTSTVLPAWNSAVIDTSNGITTTGTGPFNTAVPPVVSQAVLVLTIAMTPTTGGLASPLLINWKVQEDCVPSE